MDSDALSAAVVLAIKDCAVPHIDRRKLAQAFGMTQGRLLAARISALVQEAVGLPVDWRDMTLEQGVNAILLRFSDRHPELSQEALHEIGRCVGWNLR
ncbi:hypothetical protein [Mycobacterium intracellulare]|uniref:hypothetical protein n=1 Tax=Mycobacterium intracellulare TaxID=1767 RepID=UPI0009F4AD59|nr:hypothetical protein [Mycobacterium intracellulare]